MEDNSIHELNRYHMSLLESYKRVKSKENLFNALKILCQNKAKIKITIKNEKEQTPKNNPKNFNNDNYYKNEVDALKFKEKKKWDFNNQSKYYTKYDNTQYELDNDNRDEDKKNIYDNYNKRQFDNEQIEYSDNDNKKQNMNDKYDEKNRCNLCDRPYDSNFWILHKCRHKFCEVCVSILIENGENIPKYCPLTECNSEIIKNDKEFIVRKIKKMFSCNKCQLEKPLKKAIILHDCKHLFCLECFKNLVQNGERTNCPLKSCMKKINKEDLNFIRGINF